MKSAMECTVKTRRYLFMFGQNKSSSSLYEFGTAEVHAVAKTLNITVSEVKTDSVLNKGDIRHPIPQSSYAMFNCSGERDVRALMSKLMVSKSAVEVWGGGKDYDELDASIALCPDELKSKYYKSDVQFSFKLKGIDKKIPMPQQTKRIVWMLDEKLHFEGQVNLRSPEEVFYIVEDYLGVDKAPESEPAFIYFGRLIAEGQRSILDAYALKDRKLIGNTAMEPEMSFIMANMACVKPGSLVIDPFVGSGSILISAAHYGAMVTGADINYNVIHAKGKSSRANVTFKKEDETILNTLRQYGLGDQFVDVLLSDAAQHGWNTNMTICLTAGTPTSRSSQRVE